MDRAPGASSLANLEHLWAETLGDARITVAVLDGPVDLEHPCFKGSHLRSLPTLIPNDSDLCPAAEHGTHVASLIFAQPGSPVRGIAPDCSGLILPVFCGGGESLSCSQLDLARAITRAVEEGAQVINISGGQIDASGQAEHFLASAVRLCKDNGVLIVAAAGNDGCECLHVPAAMSSVLAVGAMDVSGLPLAFSNWGEAYRTHGILALGQGLQGAIPGGGTADRSGTSYAAAVVSGVVALLLSRELAQGRKPDPFAVRDALLASAIGCDEQAVPDCRRLLAGRLDVQRASAHLSSQGGFAMPDPVSAVIAQTALEPVAAVCPVSTSPVEVTPSTPLVSAGVESSRFEAQKRVMPSGTKVLAYALGQIGYDFVSEARRDSFVQAGLANPYDPAALLSFLQDHPTFASAVTWTLSQESTPIYAIRGTGPFGAEVYATLREFLNDQLNAGVEQVSVPGEVSSTVQLLNGQTLPVLWAEVRGMYSWSVNALLERLPHDDQAQQDDVRNFLERVYYELRNLGQASPERAMNFAATNAFQVNQIYGSALSGGLKLDCICVEHSPVSRPNSDCWDVQLTFFHPLRRLEQAKDIYRFTVDVSDVVPVTVGTIRHWQVY